MKKGLLVILALCAAVSPAEVAGTRYFLEVDFDAECDGIVNDHDAIQEALDEAPLRVPAE